jgi:hypothetical protein
MLYQIYTLKIEDLNIMIILYSIVLLLTLEVITPYFKKVGLAISMNRFKKITNILIIIFFLSVIFKLTKIFIQFL